MLATVQTASLSGIDSHPVEVQARYGPGLPGIEIVGLPEAGVRESRVRVRAALDAAQVQLPSRKVVLNLAPADVRKSGSALDLPIALSLTTAADVTPELRLRDTLVLGELSLDGSLRPVRGLLAHLTGARERGLTHALVPAGNAQEACLVQGMDVRCAQTLVDVLHYLTGAAELPRPRPLEGDQAQLSTAPDLSDVRGHSAAKRALEVAAVGSHNVLLLGPPGTGKTMLAQRLGGLLPELAASEALEVATIQSAAGLPLPGRLDALARPFRAPHHSASRAALIGGGTPLSAGEVTLAHGGVLFLDELPEFARSSLESLRPTMESGRADIVRASQRASWPARPLVIAAMNPCPCGFLGDPKRLCRCSPDAVERYRARVSGPLLDRFDLHVHVGAQPARNLRTGPRGESSHQVRERAARARAFASETFVGKGRDAGMARSVEEWLAHVESDALGLLERAVDALGLSTRAYAKALRIAASIAALASETRIHSTHMAEALGYRSLDREPGHSLGAA